MILKRATITNYRGVTGSVSINFDLFNCIVGQNDAGKSTILKALDVFLNEVKPSRADLNVLSAEQQFSIELFFDCGNNQHFLGELIQTTIENEELVNTENLLVMKKTWTATDSNVSTPKTSLIRKKYEAANDFVLKPEAQLMAQCAANQIVTTKGNGDQFNNKSFLVSKSPKLFCIHQHKTIYTTNFIH